MRTVKVALMKAMSAAALLLMTAQPMAAPRESTLSPLEQLGKEIFFAKISSPDRQSCADCHDPKLGFTGPISGINVHGGVYRGAMPQRFGNRKPPSAAYATLAENFHYDADEGIFEGGNFWDGRATGDHLGNPAADQALGPFLNPVEQNNPSKQAVLEQIAASRYAVLWEVAWGAPISYATPADIDLNYDRVGLSIAAYEGSSEVNQFSSKWDLYMRGEAELTPQEQWGMELFDGKAKCSACHPAPLFTDFTFDNLGVPRNPQNPFYDMDRVFLDDGSPINPQGEAWIDPGLGGYLASLPVSYFTALGLDKDQTVSENWGKQKVPTLRNVDRRPGARFPKAYAHNGFFVSLKEIVHFYNTRDVMPWPAPEVPQNVNTTELGNLLLTDQEEDAVVAFLGTLSDGYVRRPAPGPHAAKGAVADAQGGILLTLPVAASGSIKIFDVSGREIRDLGTQRLNEGSNTIRWDGLDNGGHSASTGLYFYRIVTPHDRVTVKAVLTR
jgi:cytochrome c peroxidase